MSISILSDSILLLYSTSTFLLDYNRLTAVVVGTRGVTIYSADEARRYTVLGSGEGGQI